MSDSALIGKRVANLRQITCASPAYLRQYGEPKSLDDLKNHRAVNYVSRTTAKLFPFEFMVDGELKEVAIEGAHFGVRRRNLCRLGDCRAGA